MVELAGQEARLADLLLKTKTGESEKEGEGGGENGEDENRGYWVKQEVFSHLLFWGRSGKVQSGVN